MRIGVFANDPGGKTGLAWAILDPGLGDIGEVLRGKRVAGSMTIGGDVRSQVKATVEAWDAFRDVCTRRGIPDDRIWYVCENFVLRPGQTAGGVDSTLPLALIWGIEGYRMGRGMDLTPVVLQEATTALSLKRWLRDWGCWIVGKEHERSAWCHLAMFTKLYLQQHGV